MSKMRKKITFVFVIGLILFLILDVYAQESTIIPPEKYKIIENPDGSTTIINEGEPEKPFVAEAQEFKLEIGAKITISQDYKKFELKGKGDISLYGKKLKGIENAVIEINEQGDFVFAYFFSPKGGEYSFEHNGRTFIFIVGENGGDVLFNLKDNILTGENAELVTDDFQVISGFFQINLNENGEIKSITLKGLSEFKYRGKTFFSEKEFEVFFDSTDISNKENVLSINDNLIKIKGRITMNNGITYNPFSDNAFTEFDNSNNIFNVLEGDVELGNKKHTIRIKDGIANLKFENLDSMNNAEEFSYFFTNKNGKEEYGIISEDNFYFTTEDGKKLNSISLSEWEERMSYDSGEIEETIIELEFQLEYLTKKGATTEEKNTIKAQLLDARNMLLLEQGKIDEAIENTKKFLSEPGIRDSGSLIESYAKVSLAEMQIKRALDSQENNEKLQSSIETLLSIKQSAMDSNNLNLFESATKVLANTYLRQEDFAKAAIEYRLLALKTESDSVRSKAYRLVGLSEIRNNNIAVAMQEYARALEIDPSNEQARQELQQLNINVLRNIIRGLGVESSELYKLFEEKTGLTGLDGSYDFIKDPIGTTSKLLTNLPEVFGNTAKIYMLEVEGLRGEGAENKYFLELKGKRFEIAQQQLGALTLLSLSNQGIDINEYMSARLSEKYAIIQEALGVDIKDARNRVIATLPLARQNSDIALLLSRGNYALASQITDKPSPEFNFITGEGYVDPGLLQRTWKDTIIEGIDLKNAFFILAPEALIGDATVAGWAFRGLKTSLETTKSTTRLLTALQRASEFPGVNSGITEFGAEFLGGVGLSQIAPEYVVDIAGVLTGRLGVKTTNAAKRLLLTSDGEIVPLLKYGTKSQMDNAIGSAKKISENLYETTMDGKTIRFAASFRDEVPERIGSATVLEEFDGNVVDDLTRVRVRGLQKKAYESGVGYYDDDLLMMETFGTGTRFMRNRGVNPLIIKYKDKIKSITSSTNIDIGGRKMKYTKHISRSSTNSYYVISESEARYLEERVFLDKIRSGEINPETISRTGYIEIDTGQNIGFFVKEGKREKVTTIRIYWEKIGDHFAIHGYPRKIN